MSFLSIITVTYQAGPFIRRTLESLTCQSSQMFEYVLIDGGSRDDTLSILKEFESRIDYLVSEPDQGLYDAMNKGLRAASGKYVWFMNAGDTLADPDLVKDLLTYFDKNPDVIYGDALFVNNIGSVRGLRSIVTPHSLPNNLRWQDMRYGMRVCHQSFIARASLAPEYRLDNLSADIDWEIKILKKAQKTMLFPRPLSRYLEGGISNQQIKRSWKDRFWVLQTHFGWATTLWSHGIILVRGVIKILRERKKYW